MLPVASYVLSYALFLAGDPAAQSRAEPTQAAADICAPGEGTCALLDAGPLPAAYDTYATPAEVDCRTDAAATGNSAGGGSGQAQLFGGCEAPSFDFRYRVSRFPDSERPNGALGPQRGRRSVSAAVTCAGLPPDRGGTMQREASPPLALYESIRLSPPGEKRIEFSVEGAASSRVVEPLDRPPRA